MNYGSLISEYTQLKNEAQSRPAAEGASVLRFMLDALRKWRYRV
ncbi:hypothetical protein [Paludibacterium yongneupense]|nr:hypothetical protein [Paludibacterium yongneupense]